MLHEAMISILLLTFTVGAHQSVRLYKNMWQLAFYQRALVLSDPQRFYEEFCHQAPSNPGATLASCKASAMVREGGDWQDICLAHNVQTPLPRYFQLSYTCEAYVLERFLVLPEIKFTIFR